MVKYGKGVYLGSNIPLLYKGIPLGEHTGFAVGDNIVVPKPVVQEWEHAGDTRFFASEGYIKEIIRAGNYGYCPYCGGEPTLAKLSNDSLSDTHGEGLWLCLIKHKPYGEHRITDWDDLDSFARWEVLDTIGENHSYAKVDWSDLPIIVRVKIFKKSLRQ